MVKLHMNRQYNVEMLHYILKPAANSLNIFISQTI